VLASALWTQWSVDPTSTILVVMLLMWWLGGRGMPSHGRWRTAAWWGGVASLILALNSPIDAQSDDFFWVHMIQHVLLLTVAAPLLVIARPMPRMLRALPARVRMPLVHGVRRAGWAAPLRFLARPWSAWVIFVAVLAVWHIPSLYDLALRNQGIHDFEHVTFVASALMFWNHALAIPPFATALDWPKRLAYTTTAMITSWILAIVLALAPHPLYAYYVAKLAHHGGLSAITDQQIAAGVMWVPGSVTFTIAIILAIYQWAGPARHTPPLRAESV